MKDIIFNIDGSILILRNRLLEYEGEWESPWGGRLVARGRACVRGEEVTTTARSHMLYEEGDGVVPSSRVVRGWLSWITLPSIILPSDNNTTTSWKENVFLDILNFLSNTPLNTTDTVDLTQHRSFILPGWYNTNIHFQSWLSSRSYRSI